MGYLFYEIPVDGVDNDASVDHVIQEKLTLIERPSVEPLPNRSTNIKEDGVH